MSSSGVPASSSSSGSSGSSSSSSGSTKGLDKVDVSQFLQLMITQLQHQDPLNPTSNADLMRQIGEIQQISSTNNLTSTLNSIALGQTITSSTALIGKQVDGLDDSGNAVSGVVQKVSIVNNAPKLYVGTQVVSLANVKDVSTVGS